MQHFSSALQALQVAFPITVLVVPFAAWTMPEISEKKPTETSHQKMLLLPVSSILLALIATPLSAAAI
ncbi:hypothetical protein SCA6_012325 [Theobroma cacao]